MVQRRIHSPEVKNLLPLTHSHRPFRGGAPGRNIQAKWFDSTFLNFSCGCRLGVRHCVAIADLAGSTPVTRSILSQAGSRNEPTS